MGRERFPAFLLLYQIGRKQRKEGAKRPQKAFKTTAQLVWSAVPAGWWPTDKEKEQQ
jgi:hypothetical protein